MGEQANKSGASQRGVNRRTVVKGAAWTVPAVVVASATPAMASASAPVTIDFGESTGCKIPGSSWGNSGYEKGYVLWAAFENNSAVDLWVKVNDFFIGTVEQCLVATVDTSIEPETCPPPTTNECIMIPAGEQKIIGIFSNGSDNSSSTTLTVNFTIYEGANCTGVSTETSDKGVIIGDSWTTGGGSCQSQNKFPANYDCRIPPTVQPSCVVA